MEQFIFFFLLHRWCVVVFAKLNKLDEESSPLRDWAANIKKKRTGDFIYGALVCRSPCLDSHIGLALSIPIIIYKSIEMINSSDMFYFIGSNWYYFFFGWMAAGLSNIIHEMTSNE